MNAYAIIVLKAAIPTQIFATVVQAEKWRQKGMGMFQLQ